MSELIGSGDHCIICDERFVIGHSSDLNCHIVEVIENYNCYIHKKCIDFVHNVTHCNKSFFEQASKTRETALSVVNKARETYFRNISQQKTIDYLRKFISFICDKTLIVIVNGEDYTFHAIGNETALELKRHILHEAHDPQPPEKWELLRQNGLIIKDDTVLNELIIPKSEKLILSLKLFEGEAIFVSSPHYTQVNKNGDIFSCEALDKEMKKLEYHCVPYGWSPVASNISMSACSLTNEEIKESYEKARSKDNILSVSTELDYLNTNIQAVTENHMVLTSNGFETIKDFIERNRDLVSFVTEPADKIGYGRKLFTEECDAQCGHRRLPFEEQEKYISNFREESITFRIHSKMKRLCQECFDVISYFPIEYDEESVMYIVASSISFVDKITKFYSTFSHLAPLSVYQARRAYCEARMSGLTDEQIVSEIRSRLMNVATKKVILGKADEQFEKQREQIIKNEAKFIETRVLCPVCERGTVPTEVTGDYCAACYDLKTNYCDPGWTNKRKDEELKKSLEYYENQKKLGYKGSEYLNRRRYIKMKYDPFLKCKICGEETNSKHITYCDECIQLKTHITARYKKFDEKFIDDELKKSLEYYKRGVQDGNTSPRYDTRLYFLELLPVYSDEKCCVCSSDLQVVKYNEKYPLCEGCATLYECCSKSFTNERAIEELKKSLVFAKPKNHEEEITLEDRRRWLAMRVIDVTHFEEYCDSNGYKVFSNSMSGTFSSLCSVCGKDMVRDSAPMRFALSHSSTLCTFLFLEAMVHTACSEHIKKAKEEIFYSNALPTIEDAKNILYKAQKLYQSQKFAEICQSKVEQDAKLQKKYDVQEEEKCEGVDILGKRYAVTDYFERTKRRKDPISFYGNYENPDACIICGNACDKEKKIIDTPHGFKIAIRIHENHLKYIDVNCDITHQIQEGKTEWQNDCAVAEEILTNASNKFKKEFSQWQKEQGSFAVEKRECANKRVKKKPTNEIRLLGTGDLKL